MGSAKAQGLSWAVAKFIHGMLDFDVAHGRQLPLFREVLANQAIGVLVQSALPRGIRMSEAYPRLKVSGHAGMATEFAPVVICDGMNLVDMRRQPLRDCVAHGLGGLARDCADNGVAGLALDQRHQGAEMAFADHCVALPIADAAP